MAHRVSNTRTVLLVDDDPEIRAALRRALRGPEYQVIEAPDGETGLAVFRTNPIDIVISDYEMPGMDGLDLLQRVRLQHPRVLRILLTGRADVQVAMRALNEGAANRMLLKPWDQVDLVGTLRIATRASAMMAAAADHSVPPAKP
jgi:DNA-binding response OmpR family regulator